MNDIRSNTKNEERYEKLVAELYANYKEITLPPEYSYFVKDNLLQFLIRLARYKFVARHIKTNDDVLEVGCGSGLGAILLGQHCRSVKGIDIKHQEIKEAKAINPRSNVEYELMDFFELQASAKYDVVCSLDVIEHLTEQVAKKLIHKTTQHLHKNGMLVIGTPSLYCRDYQSELSRAAHIKLYDQKELVDLIETYYGRALAFSMNDELVHTGFSKLAWYYIIIAFYPQKYSD